MTTDWKALCVELTEVLRRQHDWYIEDNGATLPQLDELVARARTALSEPEPEGPTLDEIDDLCAEHSFCYEDSESLECLLLIITDALARWGNSSAPQPIPVSERPPGPEDCDAEGRCWWLKERANPDHDLLMPTWHLQRQGPAGTRFFRFTHWLPAHALPVPQ